MRTSHLSPRAAITLTALVMALVPAAASAAQIKKGDILVADANAFNGPGGIIKVDPATGAQEMVSSGDKFSFPIDVTVEFNRQLVVSDGQAFGGGGGLIRVDPVTGRQTTVASGGSFVDPGGVALEADGDILVTDANAFGGGGAVFRVDPDTGAQTTVSSGGMFKQPTDIAVAPNGDIFVTENNDGTVLKVDPTTGAQTLVATTGDNQSIAIEAAGTILVSQPGFSRTDHLFRINPAAATVGTLSEGGSFNQPIGIAIESDDDIVVADQEAFGGQGGVIRVDPTTGAQSTVASVGSFLDPFGITVVPPAAPFALNDNYAIDEDGQLNVSASNGVLDNDTELDGEPMTAQLVAAAAHGTLAFNASGSFRYTPAGNYSGPDSFTYRASDGSLTSRVTTVSLTVEAGNDMPVTERDSYATDEDTTLDVDAPGVLGNDTDVDGDTLTALLVTDPDHGQVTLRQDGSLTYTPDRDYHGQDGFTYWALDGVDSVPAEVVIDVRAVNDAPDAAGDAYATDEDTPLIVMTPTGVLSNDTDADGNSLTAVLVSAPAHGDLTLADDGSLRYAPDRDYNGTDTFSYRASDGSLETDPVTVTIAISAVYDPKPPATRPSTPTTPSASAEPAISHVRLGARCVRRSSAGQVRLKLRMRLARPGAVQVRLARAAGSQGRSTCPRRSGSGTARPHDTHFRPIGRAHEASTQATTAAVSRRLTLKLRLKPGLYRVTVRAQLDDGRLSRPVRRYFRVLK